jgi:hypothetical protein
VRVVPELAKHIVRGRVSIDRHTFVAGQLPTIRAALRQLQVQTPEPEDYPPSSHAFLHRRVALDARVCPPPAGGGGRADLHQAPRHRETVYRSGPSRVCGPARASGEWGPPVWCSEVLDFVSEYRVFVVGGNVVGVRHYDGDAARSPDASAIAEMVEAMAEGLPAGCAIDVGVLSTGRTALIEVNDGFSLGRYGLGVDAYTDLLLARSRELAGPADPP